MLYHVAKVLYRILGWEIDRDKPRLLWKKKNVLVGFPHTSMKDTVLTMVGMHLLKKRSHTFIKKESFFWPLSWFLKLNNAIPVDRSVPGGIVQRIVSEFNNNQEFSVNIVPQGTRQSGSNLKTGFWHIATQANASIICWYFDAANKRCICLGGFHPGASLDEDLKAMQKLYDQVGYTLPMRRLEKKEK